MTTTKDPDHIAYGPAKSTNLGRQEPDPNVSSPTKSIGQVNNVIKVLVALGYDPKHNEEKHDIYFTSFGFEAFTEIHKKVIRVLLGKQLSEFYYGGINTQHIYYRPIPTIQRLANESVVQSEPVSKPETTKPMTVEECGIIAVEISESIEPKLTAPQQAFFIAGFQECFKWISGNKQHQPKLTKRECPEWIKTCKDCDYGKCYPVEPMTAEEALGTFPVIRHHEISEEEMHDYYFPQEVIDFANQFASQQVAAKDREIAELKAEIERLKRTVQSYSDALCDPDIH